MSRREVVYCGIMRKFIRKGACGSCTTFSVNSPDWHRVRDACPEYQSWKSRAEARVNAPVVKPGVPAFRLSVPETEGAEY